MRYRCPKSSSGQFFFRIFGAAFLLTALSGPAAFAQVPSQVEAPTPHPSITSQLDQLRPNYVLRAGDQILIRAFEMEEISEKPFRIDGDGYLNLPVLGRIKAAGLTVERLESVLVDASKRYVRQPQISVTVVQFSSEPVFFVGAFKAPGIYPLGGQRTLVEMISAVGGLTPTASRRLKLTRRSEYGAIPLPNAVPLPDGSGSSVDINLASLQNNVNPAEDILLQPFDVLSVDRAEMVYVMGEVSHNGGLDLQEKDSLSVTQALTMAGGFTVTANTKTAWILRPISNTSRRAQIPLNMDRILKGQEIDKPLMPNDVLYVPKANFFLGDKRNLIMLLPMVVGLAGLGVALTR
ncbi:MAG TPA: polysaccharide biosynthesis/export family protein [Bryobacteraceae bacterium]|nr:polysaccharide biosynthesis/export family protein [Bryobacteraceae bacterium]